MKFRIRNAQLANDQPPTRTRIPAPMSDARPGLPSPMIRKPVTWQRPAPTTAPVTRPQQLSPTSTWARTGSVNIPQQRMGKLATVLGTTPTQTGGFRGNYPTGTGLPDQRSIQWPQQPPWVTLAQKLAPKKR